MYHHVSEDTPRVTSVTKAEFEAHLQFLRDHDFQVIPLDQAIDAVENNKSLPDKAVVITFDDAYLNIYENAAPLLREYEMPWALFVSTDPIQDEPTSYMSWNQLRELKEQGVLIANHSSDHAHMPRTSPGESQHAWQERMRNNITSAQRTLTQQLGETPKYLAYPFGEYNNGLRDILIELGYHGIGQHSGAYGSFSDPQAIPRFPASGVYANLETLQVKMNALNFPTERVEFNDTLLSHSDSKPILELTVRLQDVSRSRVQCFIGGTPVAPNWVSENTFTIQAERELPIGRSRYNCTAPSDSLGNRFYWFSKQWIRPDARGSWPD